MRELKETRNIQLVMIFEIVGRPPEHLTESLKKIIEEMDKEKGVKIISKNIKKPVIMKDQKDFYTSFAELELEVEEVINLAILMFKYMPAHIEIVSPELIALTNNGWNDIFNELTRRLHGYDELARALQFERAVLEKKLREVLGVPEQAQQEQAKLLQQQGIQVDNPKTSKPKTQKQKKKTAKTKKTKKKK